MSAGAPGKPEPAVERARLRARAMKALGSTRAAVTGFVTLAGAVLGVLFLAVPSLKPLSRDQIDVTVSIPEIQTHVPLREWVTRQFSAGSRKDVDRHLRDILERPPNATDEGTYGTVVYVKLATHGFQHRSVKLRVMVLDPHTHEPSGLDLTPVPKAASSLRIDAPSRASVQLLYIDDLQDLRTSVFLRVEAYDGGGILAYADSGRIFNNRICRAGSTPPSCAGV